MIAAKQAEKRGEPMTLKSLVTGFNFVFSQRLILGMITLDMFAALFRLLRCNHFHSEKADQCGAKIDEIDERRRMVGIIFQHGDERAANRRASDG